MYGPATNLADGGSLIFHSECQTRFSGTATRTLIEGGHKSIEPREDVHQEYYERTQAELETLVGSHEGETHSWYKNAHRKIFILSPWQRVDYWNETRSPDMNDYEFDRSASA